VEFCENTFLFTSDGPLYIIVENIFYFCCFTQTLDSKYWSSHQYITFTVLLFVRLFDFK